MAFSSLAALALVLAVAFRARPVAVLEAWSSLRLSLRGVESQDLMVGGHRIHYLAQGPHDGRPVVLVHGLGDRAEHWGALVKYLVDAGMRVYTPDLLGCGQSDKPADATYSIPEQANVILGWLDAAGLQQVDLGGWSMGGWIVQEVALAHPERVRRLMLFDSAGLNVPPDWDVHLFTPESREEFARFQALLSPHPRAIPAFVLDDVLRTRASTNWIIQRALASMLTGKDVTDATLYSLTMPVLILWGSLDRVTPLSEAQSMHRLIAHSDLQVIDGCGHLAPAECASEMGPRAVKFLESP